MRSLAHTREMDEALDDWERYSSLPLERLPRERDLKNMVLHALLPSIQAAIDIANNLISEEGLRRLPNYREAFKILGEAELVDDDPVRGLSDLAGFRNGPVHIYWERGMEMVYHILQNDRKHFVVFRDEVKRILRCRSGGGK
jgi:uncharacterized protein YutE (UPF0331/DUF86 family)